MWARLASGWQLHCYILWSDSLDLSHGMYVHTFLMPILDVPTCIDGRDERSTLFFSVSIPNIRNIEMKGDSYRRLSHWSKCKHFAIDTLLHVILGQWLQCVDSTCTVCGSRVGCWLLEETKIWVQPPANIILCYDIPIFQDICRAYTECRGQSGEGLDCRQKTCSNYSQGWDSAAV